MAPAAPRSLSKHVQQSPGYVHYKANPGVLMIAGDSFLSHIKNTRTNGEHWDSNSGDGFEPRHERRQVDRFGK
jgi:hypothetical protein